MMLRDVLQKKGFVVVPQLFSAADLEQVDRATAEMIRQWRAGDSNDRDFWSCHMEGFSHPVLYRIHNLETKHRSVGDISDAPALRQIVESALGESGFPTAFALVIKMPDGGAAVPWHRDPVNVQPSRVFNFSIYLDDSLKDNGCLEVLEGSHVLDMDTRVDNEHPAGALRVVARRGDVIIHDVRLFHGSGSSTSVRPRRSIVIEFRPQELI